MRIAIIGAGNVGGGLAAAATTAGHDVVVSATRPSSAQDTAAETGAQEPLDAFLAADDEQAKSTVGALVESLGFRPVDLGGLRMARTLEELAFANISINATRGWAWQSAFRLVGPQAAS
jgi:8-hydroxy-5-deazaflavin:NADPH oxidoreductase